MKTICLVLGLATLVAMAMPEVCYCDRKTPEESFATEVKGIMDKYSASLLAGDGKAWISLWDDSGVQMPANELMIKGKETIQRTMDLGLRVIKYEVFDIEIVKTYVEGSLGYVFGNYKYAYKYKGGTRVERFGKYVTILKKSDDGTWKIVLDCSNLNTP